MCDLLHLFDNIHLVRCHFHRPQGGVPEPLCFVGKNISTGTVSTWTRHDGPNHPVYTTDERDLVVAFSAEEVGQCIRSLGWELPLRFIDLRPLFRCKVNHFGESQKSDLISALHHFNLPGFAMVERKEDRDLASRGGSYTQAEIDQLTDACMRTVEAMERLLPLVSKSTSLQNAYLMSRYSLVAVSAIQAAGVPIHHSLLHRILSNREGLRASLINQLDCDTNVYRSGSFDEWKFQTLTKRMGINWPRTRTLQLRLDKETFKEQARIFPQLKPLAELQSTLAALGNIRPSLGSDGRNRTDLGPFASTTGRNQPSTATDVFSWPRWARHLMRPSAGRAILILDYGQQEFLAAAALSGDSRMLDAYRSGDPYLASSRRVGGVVPNGPKLTHDETRDLYKMALLAIQYGCTERGLTYRVGSHATATRLLEEHKSQYSAYHRWSQNQVERLLLGSPLKTPLGWVIQKGATTPSTSLNTRSIANWAVQAAGSDILRVATIALVEHGFTVIATAHDAIAVECALNEVGDVRREAIHHMRLACEVVLGVEGCRIDVREVLPSHDIMAHNVPAMFKRILSLLPPAQL